MAKKRLKRKILRKTSGKCFYCQKRIAMKRKKTAERLTLDHYVPKAEGGSNGHNNLVPCCFDCNQKKGRMLPEIFLSEVKL